MATYVNFTTLFQDVTRYLERGSSITNDQTVFEQIPRLINGAERKLIQTLKLLGTLEVLIDPVGLVAGVAVVTKPDRWRQTVSMNYGTGAGNNAHTPLFPRSYENLRTLWPDDTVTSEDNPPEFYADYDLLHWLIAPTPPANYPLEALCYMQPVLLDETNQTNFWTNYTPNLLLYGTLLEATPFLKGDERIPVWQSYWDREIGTLDAQELQRMMDRATQRDKP